MTKHIRKGFKGNFNVSVLKVDEPKFGTIYNIEKQYQVSQLGCCCLYALFRFHNNIIVDRSKRDREATLRWREGGGGEGGRGGGGEGAHSVARFGGAQDTFGGNFQI